jgi:predicted RNase H-like HicB family nuclease/lambda repressor-like predicted transcriptional regulator
MNDQFQIFIYHDRTEYVAEVPELPIPPCRGRSRALALADAEQAIDKFIQQAVADGRKVPIPAKTLFLMRPAGFGTKRSPSTVVALLRQRFGGQPAEALAVRLGVHSDLVAFRAACAGAGPREMRVVIAMALEKPPSELWPVRSYATRRRDDESFYQALQAKADESSQ